MADEEHGDTPIDNEEVDLVKQSQPISVPRHLKLRSNKVTLQYSLWALRFNAFCNGINQKILNPNFAVMAKVGLDPESFPSTSPFDYNSAMYFIPMCTLLGVAISSVFVGLISDRVGRKSVLVILGIMSAAGSALQFFCRGSFWPFCIANFCSGIFQVNLPVAMAYVGDVYTVRVEKDAELGLIMGLSIMAIAFGGIFSIFLENAGLFLPLWIGFGLMIVSTIVLVIWMIEPGDSMKQNNEMTKQMVEDEEDEVQRPGRINKCVLSNITIGAVLDNFGSTGIMPFALAPLMLNNFCLDFLARDETPLMSLSAYKWITTLLAIAVVPSAISSPKVFAKFGVAMTCVIGNTCTAVVTIALLLICTTLAPTRFSMAIFIIVLYLGFPTTIFSQLTTGPMLDLIAPKDQIGFVQGINNTTMNFGMAVAPWFFGLIADWLSVPITMWLCIGISLFAALVNVPLTFFRPFRPSKPVTPISKSLLPGEDKDVVDKALNGDFVDQEKLHMVNIKRGEEGKPFIIPKIKSYEDDKEFLTLLSNQARQNFEYRVKMLDGVLAAIGSESEEKNETKKFCRALNKGNKAPEEQLKAATNDIGKWIGDYLMDVGYNPHVLSFELKQMVMSSFPPITMEKEFTPENLETVLVQQRQVFNDYLEMSDKKDKFNIYRTLGTGAMKKI